MRGPECLSTQFNALRRFLKSQSGGTIPGTGMKFGVSFVIAIALVWLGARMFGRGTREPRH
ncbi:hypothetical protein DID99_27040 [Burkholderia sp. Bp8986]|nr:hypothetical protein DID99_27040 [Burkholderia sp. Bp8986]